LSRGGRGIDNRRHHITFSIVGRSADGLELGVEVASKFLAAGAYVPAAAVGAGALATQAYANLELRTRGLDMLAGGMSAARVLDEFFAGDAQRDERQAGVVDGRAAVWPRSPATGARPGPAASPAPTPLDRSPPRATCWPAPR
jgi:hypothetical protein